jgi:hypothetical protein
MKVFIMVFLEGVKREGKSLDVLENVLHNCRKLGRLNGRALDGRV